MDSLHVHLDPVGGLAGDMFLAACLDAGLVPLSELQEVLRGLDLEGPPLRIGTSRVERGGHAALRLDLHLSAGPSRTYPEIMSLLEESDLPPEVRDVSRALFHRFAEVDAGVRGVSLDEVRLDEPGALDYVVDFVGAALVVSRADATWSVGTLRLGSGTVLIEEGEIPVPAPTTLELLRGFEVERESEGGELITPTGATILAHLRAEGLLRAGEQDRPGNLPGYDARVGYGAGQRDPEEVSNVVRLLVLDPGGGSASGG